MSQYVHHQLLRAMRTAADHPDPDVREAALERVEHWQQVIDGMADGTLRLGSRRPLVGLPAWVTPRVVRGGFATGKAAAAIPPAPPDTGPAGSARPRADRPRRNRPQAPVPAVRGR